MFLHAYRLYLLAMRFVGKFLTCDVTFYFSIFMIDGWWWCDGFLPPISAPLQRTDVYKFGWALKAVGAIASLYHSSSGRMRLILRKADYYSIAVSSAMLRAAAFGTRLPVVWAALMISAMPFKPTMITAANLISVEVHIWFLSARRMHPQSSSHALYDRAAIRAS